MLAYSSALDHLDILSLLRQGLAALPVELPTSLASQLCRYLELLHKWNRAYNLTAVRDPREMVARHALDSLAVLPYIEGDTLLDVGSGAGLPGLPLAMARPSWQCALLDSNGKKTRFITQAVAELGLRNVEVAHCRVKAYRPDRRFATVISRAYADLAAFYRDAAPLCAPGGCLLAMKGALPLEEMASLQGVAASLEAIPLDVPGLPAQRHLIRLRPG